MTEDAVEDLQRKVKTLPVVLNVEEKPDALRTMRESTDAIFHAKAVQYALALMSVGDMTEIMPQRNRLNKVFIESKTVADDSSDLGDHLDMEYTVSNMVILK